MADNFAESTGTLAAQLYDELREVAAGYLSREDTGHTLQPTALVNEAMARVLGQARGSPEDPWASREQFLGIVAICMRRVLVDHARSRGRTKRGGGATRVALDDSMAVAEQSGVDLVELNEALDMFARSYPRQASVVEFRVFMGLEFEHIARVVAVSLAQVKRDWKFARAWLAHRISSEHDERRNGDTIPNPGAEDTPGSDAVDGRSDSEGTE